MCTKPFDRPVVEALEGRRLMSSDPFVLPVVPVVLGPIAKPVVNEPAAPTPTPAPTPAPVSMPATPGVRSMDLTGTFSGKIEAKLFWFVKKDFDAVLTIDQQTPTNLTGSIEIDGHKFSGTFTGKIKPSGKFSYKLKDDGVKIKIEGKLNRVGNRIEGKIEAKYSVIKVKGGFDFKKDVT